LHALLTQGSPINVRIFQDRQEAAQWLNAPIALITPDASETIYQELTEETEFSSSAPLFSLFAPVKLL